MAEPAHIHVSVAWPYSNGDLHMGHLAGAYLPADIFARYHRLRGNRVLMVSGSDSHGTPVVIEAEKQGITPRALFEHYHHRFLKTQQALGISYDLFTHTDTESHHKIAQDIFLKLRENGDLYIDTQLLLYSEVAQRFLPDRFVEGTCPICGFAKARGDQCDNCGNLLEATQLINPRSKLDGSTPVVREADHFFLDLSRFIDRLQAYLSDKDGYWRANVLPVSRSRVPHLVGRPITRDMEWGIKLPIDDPAWASKRLYVWFEAVMGYLTASIEWANNIGEPEAWKRWWYNPKARIYNFLGKDNIEFHTIIWPAELMGIDGLYRSPDDSTPLNLPYDVPANEFMTIEGEKFSKSNNWAIWLPDIIRRFDVDAIRFCVAAAIPESKDADFNWEEFIARNNGILVAKWGNLCNRILTYAAKNFDGKVPTPGPLHAEDEAILSKIEAGFAEVGALLEAVKIRGALNAVVALTDEANAYLERRAPWQRIKVDRDDAGTIVYTALRVIDNLKTLWSPFVPFTSQKVHAMLGYDTQIFGEQKIQVYQESERSHEALIYDASNPVGHWEKSVLPAGQTLRTPKPLFRKLGNTKAEEEAIIDAERALLGQKLDPAPLD